MMLPLTRTGPARASVSWRWSDSAGRDGGSGALRTAAGLALAVSG